MIYNLICRVTKKINFTINENSAASSSYEAEEGMIWGDWVNSTYNTGNYVANTARNRVDKVQDHTYYVGPYNTFGSPVKLTDVIETNGEYWLDETPYKG